MSTAANKLDSTGYDKRAFPLSPYGPTRSTLKSTPLSVDELHKIKRFVLPVDGMTIAIDTPTMSIPAATSKGPSSFHNEDMVTST
jgi:hypothetical protein